MSLFITFEGIEGCGKSTQAKYMAEYIKNLGFEVLHTREPGGPAISEKIRELLLDKNHQEMLSETELLLYMASRSQHTGEWIIPALKAGKIVICDRYYDSTIAYQGAGRSLDYEFITRLTRFATYGLIPNITILLDLPVEEGMKRMTHKKLDRLELENIEFHRKVRKGFLAVAKEETDRYIIIDASQSVEAINKIIEAIISSKLKDGLK